MKWFLSELECAICNDSTICLHPELEDKTMECGWCGYEAYEADTIREVPESFAKSEHKLAGVDWSMAL